MMTILKAHLMIHGFAVLHGGTAFWLAQVPAGPTAVLTAETLTFVYKLARSCGADVDKSVVESFAQQKLAEYLGVTLITEFGGKIPIAGNVLQAGFSASVTEFIGWQTVKHFAPYLF